MRKEERIGVEEGIFAAKNIRGLLKDAKIGMVGFEKTVLYQGQGYLSRVLEKDRRMYESDLERAAEYFGLTAKDLLERDFVKELRKKNIAHQLAELSRELMELEGEKYDLRG